jgi:hypothetical protein
MPLRAIARLIQTMLYARRFFPYYVYNILGGIEEDGESSLFLWTRLRGDHRYIYFSLPRTWFYALFLFFPFLCHDD